MEKVKCVCYAIEILLSIWILYRSGRILLNKGDADESSFFLNNELVLIFVSCTGFVTNLCRICFSSWILLYSSMLYVLSYIIRVIKESKKKKTAAIIFWVLAAVTIPII